MGRESIPKLGVFERIKARLVAGGDYVSRLDAGEIFCIKSLLRLQ